MNTKAAPTDVSGADAGRVLDEVLQTSSDRAAIITAVALIDSQLRALVGKKDTLSKLIEKARKRSLIDQGTSDALDLARCLRNDFAHEWLPPALTEPDVADRVNALADATLTSATSQHFSVGDRARLSCLALALAIRIARRPGKVPLTIADVRHCAEQTVERARVVTEAGDQIVTNDGHPVSITEPLAHALENAALKP